MWLVDGHHSIKGMSCGSLDSKFKNEGPDSRDEKVICLLSNFRDRQTLWLIELLYAIQRDLLEFIRRLHAKNCRA